MFKHLLRSWKVEARADGKSYLLKLDDPSAPKEHAGRVVLVTEDGQFECSRDGQDSPLVQFDCGNQALNKVRKHLKSKETQQ